MKKLNPFNITKAVDYSDEDLDKLWVDFPIKSFKSSIKPTSNVPMIILGSKGSGKTHILKHFSFTMQKIRHKDGLLEGIKNDGYFGTYLRCSGLNGFRFSGGNEKEEIWDKIFAYYFELWLSQLMLNNILNLVANCDIKINEKKIISSILKLFLKDVPDVLTFDDLSMYLSKLQREIDFAINNTAFSEDSISSNIKILLNYGTLIFGIPKIISQECENLKSMKFLYILDEYENFTISQQKYFNTLIRERENPVCFKIGARRYGVRTKETLCAEEGIKRGSEYEEIDLDLIFREEKESYKIFIKRICFKRLIISGFSVDEASFDNYFENFDETHFLSKVNEKGRKHLNKFKSKIEKYSSNEDVCNKLYDNICFQDVLLERVNILLIYKAWKKGSDLLEESKIIHELCLSKGVDSEMHSRVLDKHKRDLLDTLARENSLAIETYVGFNNLVKISSSIPRHFLIIMKHIYRWSLFKGESIFESIDDKISKENQIASLRDTSKWFIEDAKTSKDKGRIKDSIERICNYLRELRFSDTPSESSISSFSVNTKVLLYSNKEIIDFLEQYSYIIMLKGRRDKNSNDMLNSYQINGLLAFAWELSISRRGIYGLNDNDINMIFSVSEDIKYRGLLRASLEKYNSPYRIKENINPTLF